MKALALLVFLAGCVESSSGVEAPTNACSADTECGTGVCASTGECMAASETQTAHITWTMDGQPPTDYTCYWTANIKATFWTQPEVDAREEWASAPLACTLGTVTIEKLPRRFWIGGAASPSNGMWVPLDETGAATVNLQP